LIEGDEEDFAETPGDPNSEVESTVDASKEGLEEGTLLQVGLLEGDEEDFTEILGDPADLQHELLLVV